MAKNIFLSVFLGVCLFASVLCSPLESYQTIMGVRIYDLDPDCAMLGGLCVKSSECLHLTTKSGLCPTNQRQGVECCYEFDVKEGSCRSFGGECMSTPCNERLIRSEANDCGRGQKCCVLV